MPIFSGEFLLAVVVFLCGDDESHAGAIEVWCNTPDKPNALRVMDGYYGSLDIFEKKSKQINLAKGQGIPGLAWQSGMPILMEDIGKVAEFARAVDAQQAGITTGLGIPASKSDEQAYVITFLSAKATPIAKRIQLWIPDQLGKHLICHQGHSKVGNDLAEMFETISVEKGVGALGRVWLTGMPVITGNPEETNYDPQLDSLSSMLAIPVIGQGSLKAIVAFLF